MDTGALFIGGCLLFIAGVVLASIVGSIEIGKQKKSCDHWYKAYWSLATDNGALQRQHTAIREQLEATRIALKEAQKNDQRDARGRFVRAG